MTTAEVRRLEDDFKARSAAARERGDDSAALVWDLAAERLVSAEGASITASFERSMRRRNRTSNQPV